MSTSETSEVEVVDAGAVVAEPVAEAAGEDAAPMTDDDAKGDDAKADDAKAGKASPLPAARVVAGTSPGGGTRFPAWLVGVALIPPGWLFVLAINRWHLTSATVLMLICWAAIVLTGYWSVRMALAAVDETDAEWFRARGRRDDLEREKKSLLKAIKEIEFDRETGKMSSADASDLIATYRARAIDVIKAIDALDGEGGEAGSLKERVLADLKARAAVDKAGKAKSAKASKAKAAKAGKASADKAEDAS